MNGANKQETAVKHFTQLNQEAVHSTTRAPPVANVVLASDNDTIKKSKPQGSSSMDARRQVREREPASGNRTDTSEPNRIEIKKVSHANISIDLTLTNNNANE